MPSSFEHRSASVAPDNPAPTIKRSNFGVLPEKCQSCVAKQRGRDLGNATRTSVSFSNDDRSPSVTLLGNTSGASDFSPEVNSASVRFS